tara:strand:- start:167 stop:448 length:282 start_codon:yes stop_codon:yes gene_type:complete
MITDKEQIRQVLDDYLFRFEEQRIPFIGMIKLRCGVEWLGHVQKGGVIIEGASPNSATVDGETEEKTYWLVFGSRIGKPIGSIKLSDVESIQI